MAEEKPNRLQHSSTLIAAMEVAQLPRDLIAEIFLRLPVRSLLRFKCLSKSFAALIDSFGFINAHSIRSSQAFNLRKLIILNGLSARCHVFDVNLDMKVPILCLGKPALFSLEHVYGYCKGLILFNQSHLYERPRISLWNPSTRRMTSLPKCPCFAPADARFGRTVASGLGYDESGDEYKAIYIVEVEGQHEYDCWVYGLKSIFWRRVWNFPYSFLSGMGNFAHGSVHWLGNEAEIVAFDVSKETFSSVSQPIRLTSGLPMLHVLADSICISYFSQNPVQQAELYIRNKTGSGVSWRKIFSLGGQRLFDNLSLWDFEVLGYVEGGKKILLRFGMGDLLSYDLKTKSVEIVKITNAGDWIILFLCEENLASVDSVV